MAKKLVITLATLATLGMSIAYSHIVLCATIDYSEFVSLRKNLYVEPGFEVSEQDTIKSMVERAEERIKQKYGDLFSSPTMIFTKTAGIAITFGANEYGSTHIVPWGQYIIIGPKGNSVDVIAHERFHAEIADRLGYFVRLTKLPIWFDEGVAMQVDYREQYNIDYDSLSSSEIERVEGLFSAREFFSGGQDEIRMNYSIAKAMVGHKLLQDANESLYSMLTKVKNGEDFERVFESRN